VSPEQTQFLEDAAAAAQKAGHVFPQAAACEAALESGFGKSGLALVDNNLFGMKLHRDNNYQIVTLPTKEFENGKFVTVTATWERYPDWASCFSDRIVTLNRLASTFPSYAAALAAPDAPTYIAEVSKTWATDPERGAKVLAIYNEWLASPAEGAD
jgi:flagellum-specific peptidoglycan hydrolase FlgJ